jgi:enolase
MHKITSIKAKEIKDSRDNPTIEVEVVSGDVVARASVPSGASTGSREAKNVDAKTAVKNVNEIISSAIKDLEVDPLEIDKILLKLDGTKDKSKLGANAILGVSLAITRLGAKLENKPLWKYINKISGLKIKPQLPKLFMNVINGGTHADFRLPFQEYMIITGDNKKLGEFYQRAEQFIRELGEAIEEKYGKVKMGDEGGFSPEMKTLIEPFGLISNLKDDDMEIGIDVAGSEFYKDGAYSILGEEYLSTQLEQIYRDLTEEFSVASIEDPYDENDLDAFKKITENSKNWNLKTKIKELLVVGDDLTTTNHKNILEATTNKRANAVIIKPNQIGTLTEVYNAVKIAQGAGWKIICSHRSGETEDTFISDLAVGIGAYGIKSGSPLQKERRVKYERLLEIEEEINK